MTLVWGLVAGCPTSLYDELLLNTVDTLKRFSELINENVSNPVNGLAMYTFILEAGSSLALKTTSDDTAEPFEIGIDVETDTMAGYISAQVDTQGRDFVVGRCPDSRVFGSHCFDTVAGTSLDEGFLQQAYVVSWR